MHYLLDNIDKFSQRVGKIVSYLILPIVAFSTGEVIMRFLFRRPTLWSQELTLFIFGSYFMLGAAYTLKNKGFVAMDIVYNRLNGQKRLIADILIFLSIFLVCGVMVWYGGKWEIDLILTGERSQSLWNPVLWPVRWIIPIGAIMVIIQALSDLIYSFKIIRKVKR